ncbi:MAG: stage VI sporulation protein F [Bacilli bacterium]|nr:stage VI sporulation protein F [Bacilli bacterium]
MEFNDDFFGKVKKKTNVDKETLVDLAKRLNENNMKDETVLRSIIRDLSKITGKDVSMEKEEKIIEIIKNDKVPTNVDKFF